MGGMGIVLLMLMGGRIGHSRDEWFMYMYIVMDLRYGV